MKLQHWLIDVQYLPGLEKGLADALSREEQRFSETVAADGLQSVPGDVEEPPPQMKRENMQEARRDDECLLKTKKKKEECIKRSCYITLN